MKSIINIITIDDEGNVIDAVTTVRTEEEAKEIIEKGATRESMGFDQYSRWFDEGSGYWTRDAEYNLAFLKSKQNYANELLKAKGYLFLNEVYDMLGIPKSKIGQVMGWSYDKEHPNDSSFVDFGLTRDDEQVRDFVNGRDAKVLLDFNVERNILDLI